MQLEAACWLPGAQEAMARPKPYGKFSSTGFKDQELSSALPGTLVNWLPMCRVSCRQGRYSLCYLQIRFYLSHLHQMRVHCSRGDHTHHNIYLSKRAHTCIDRSQGRLHHHSYILCYYIYYTADRSSLLNWPFLFCNCIYTAMQSAQSHFHNPNLKECKIGMCCHRNQRHTYKCTSPHPTCHRFDTEHVDICHTSGQPTFLTYYLRKCNHHIPI